MASVSFLLMGSFLQWESKPHTAKEGGLGSAGPQMCREESLQGSGSKSFIACWFLLIPT